LPTWASDTARLAAMADRPTPVQTIAVQQKTMPIYLTALGTVTPYYSVTIKARVNGQLDKVNFTEGQEVRAGQTIMVIDPKPYKAALDQAKGTLAHDQALLKNAQAELVRYKALFDAGVVSKEQLDLQQSNFGQYEGAIKSDCVGAPRIRRSPRDRSTAGIESELLRPMDTAIL